MRIEHTALYVKDLDTAKNFFVKYFAADTGEIYSNFHTGLHCCFLTFDNGSRLELMSRDNLLDQAKGSYQTGFDHIAISVGDEQAVRDLTARLQSDGYHILKGPRTTGDNYYESVIADPEGNEIELIAQG